MECYRAFNTNFDENGDIKLQPIWGVLKIELNGICEIEINHPYDIQGRWKNIEKLGVIKSKVCYNKNEQLFRIYDIDKGISGLTVKARHIYFDLIRHNILDKRAVDCDGQKALEIILSNTKFKAHSNISATNTAYFVKTNSIESINGDKDNTFIKRWGGEIVADNFDVYVNDRVGGDYGVKAKYSRNMLDINLAENTDNMITRAFPQAYDGIMLPEKYIDSPLINKYPIIFEDYIDMGDLKLKSEEDNSDDEGFETKEELYKAMRERMLEIYQNDNIDKPKLSGKVDIAILENTEEYKDFRNLVNIGIGDIITVDHKELGIDIATRCVALEWDILTEKYNSITLGELFTDYFDKQDIARENLNNILNSNGSVKGESLQGVINAFATKFKAQRDIAEKHVRAMLFEDLNPESPTYGAMCIGSMGFEIASERTPDGKNWAWSTFGSGQGFVANHIVAGVLSTIKIQNLDESFQIDLSGNNGALFRNNGKDAIRIHNNSIDLYNHAKNGDFIGALMALVRNEADGTPNPDKPLVGLINDLDSAISVGYKNGENDYKSYAEFDKNNVLKDEVGKAIRILEEIDFKNNNIYRVILSSLNEKNYINVEDDKISISFGDKNYITLENDKVSISFADNKYLVMTEQDISFGQDDANIILRDGKWQINGDVEFTGNVNGLPTVDGGVGGD